MGCAGAKEEEEQTPPPKTLVLNTWSKSVTVERDHLRPELNLPKN